MIVKKILLATNGSGYQINECLKFSFFRQSINVIVSDEPCGALDVGSSHGILGMNLAEKDSARLNAAILDTAISRNIDYIISPGFTRIFKGEILNRYRGRIFNCHPSILPAFKGYYDTRDVKRTFPARKIYERIIEFGSRVTGNTIHLVTEEVDDGCPIIVSSMNIPYNETQAQTRHRLFIQEVQCLLQIVSWLNQDRIVQDSQGRMVVKDAMFDAPYFSPNLDDPAIMDFTLDFPVTLNKKN